MYPMKIMKNPPWLDNGKFEIKSCLTLVKYIKNKTGIDCQVHKTDRYLIVNYVKNSKLNTFKIELRAGVLYCLNENDFDQLFVEMNK